MQTVDLILQDHILKNIHFANLPVQEILLQLRWSTEYPEHSCFSFRYFGKVLQTLDLCWSPPGTQLLLQCVQESHRDQCETSNKGCGLYTHN